jgi:broad specificity phosphatase PhoE
MYSPADFALYRTAPDQAVCPSGERLTDAQKRMVEAVELIGSRHAGETVAAVTHAVMIRLLVARLTDVNGEDWRIPVGRGSLTAISVQDQRISLVKLPEGTDVD